MAATLAVVVNQQLLKENGMLIVEHHEKEPLVLPEGWCVVREQQFGYTKVTYCVPYELERS